MGAVIIPTSQAKRLRHRADKQCDQGHTVGKWHHQEANQAIGLASSGLISSDCPWRLNSIQSRTWVLFPVGLVLFLLPPSSPWLEPVTDVLVVCSFSLKEEKRRLKEEIERRRAEAAEKRQKMPEDGSSDDKKPFKCFTPKGSSLKVFFPQKSFL